MRSKLIKAVGTLMMVAILVTSVIVADVEVYAARDRQEYVKNESLSSLISDAEINVYKTTEGGTVELVAKSGNAFMMHSGYREFSATPNEGWVFDGWTTKISQGNTSVVNRKSGNYYSFSNSHNAWSSPYNGTGSTISANRLGTWGETVWSPIKYTLWASFNPTSTAITADNGSITNVGQKEVEYGYDSVAYTIEADNGYLITALIIDGVEEKLEEAVNSTTYTFTSVKKPHTISYVATALYDVTYTDGVDGEVFEDQILGDLLSGTITPEFEGTLVRAGYVFNGWDPEVAETVTETVTYTATWGEDVNNNGIDDADEDKFTVWYVDGEEVLQENTRLLVGLATPEYAGERLVKEGYTFEGWDPEVSELISAGDADDDLIITYTATWEEDVVDNGDDEDKEPVVPGGDSDDDVDTDKDTEDKEDAAVKTGDTSNTMLWIILLGISLAGTAVALKERKRM